VRWDCAARRSRKKRAVDAARKMSELFQAALHQMMTVMQIFSAFPAVYLQLTVQGFGSVPFQNRSSAAAASRFILINIAPLLK